MFAQEWCADVSTVTCAHGLLHQVSLLLSGQDTFAITAVVIESELWFLFIWLSFEVVLYLLKNLQTLGKRDPRSRKLLRPFLDTVRGNTVGMKIQDS